MNWFRRTSAIEERDPQPPLEVYELEPSPPAQPVAMAWGPKPDELVRAATTREWTRRPQPPEPPAPLTVDWLEEAPTQAGVYWFVEWGPGATGRIQQCVVIDFGGRLCVRERRGDSTKYVAVGALNRHWAGPVAVPASVPLEDLDLG